MSSIFNQVSSELEKAELSIKKGVKFVQDGA